MLNSFSLRENKKQLMYIVPSLNMGPSWPFTQLKQVPASISQRPIRQVSGHGVEQVNPYRLGVEHPINYASSL